MTKPKKRRRTRRAAPDADRRVGVEDLPLEDEHPGNALGLTGRPHQPRLPDPDPVGYDDDGEPVYERGEPTARAIPANCLRVLHSPLPPELGGACNPDCVGRQRDGGCLADIVRAANEQGKEWLFDLDHDRAADRWWWVYVGEPVDMDLLKPKVKAPAAAPPPAEASSYVCPHCGTTNLLDPANWHFWCKECGRNANEPAAA